MASKKDFYAEAVFNTICMALIKKNIKFDSNRDKMKISAIFTLDALGNTEIYIDIFPKNRRFDFYVPLCRFYDSMVYDMAMAVNIANTICDGGFFDYTVERSSISYVYSVFYGGCVVKEAAVIDSLIASLRSLDCFGASLVALAEEKISFEEFSKRFGG